MSFFGLQPGLFGDQLWAIICHALLKSYDCYVGTLGIQGFCFSLECCFTRVFGLDMDTKRSSSAEISFTPLHSFLVLHPAP